MTPPSSDRFTDLTEATDRLFDRELSRAERERLSAELSRDPEALRRFRETTDALLELRKPIVAPDVSAGVLARLDARTGFTTRRTRGLITTTRLVIAAALLGAGAGVLLLEQYPQTDPGALARARAAERTLDPVHSGLYDHELAKEDFARLGLSRLDHASSGSGLLSNALALDTPRLQLDMTPVGLVTGASDWTDTSLLPYRGGALPVFLPWASDLSFDPEVLMDPLTVPATPQPLRKWRGDYPAGSLLGPGLEFSFPAPEPGENG